MRIGLLSRYLSLLSSSVILFGFFIACGSEFYRVSLHDDYDMKSAERSNPDVYNKDSDFYGIHALKGWKQLPIKFTVDKNMDAEQRAHLNAAIKKWQWAVGKQLFHFAGVDESTGDDFKDLYSSLDDEINGNYLDANWEKTKKAPHVLATTIWQNSDRSESAIEKADIRMNNQIYIIGDSLIQRSTDNKEVVDMQSLALHELGHLLGLAHVASSMDNLSIMNPSLFIGEGFTSRYLSRGDIQRIQAVYGCAGKACDIDHLMDEQMKSRIEKLTDPLTNRTYLPQAH